MTNSDNQRLWFTYFENNLFQNIVDKTLYQVKYLSEQEQVDDNVLTYSLSEDERPFIIDNIQVAINNIEHIIAGNSFNTTEQTPPLNSGEVGFSIYLKQGEEMVIIDTQKTHVVDSFCEMYIINYVFLQWSNMVNFTKLSEELICKTDYLIDAIKSLLPQFSYLPERYSFSVIEI